MYLLYLKDHCLECEQKLYYEFTYTIAYRMSTKIWCKYCNNITTYFEYDLRLVYKKMIDDLYTILHKLPIGKEELRKEYCRIQKLYLTNEDQKYQTKLDILRNEIFV